VDRMVALAMDADMSGDEPTVRSKIYQDVQQARRKKAAEKMKQELEASLPQIGTVTMGRVAAKGEVIKTLTAFIPGVKTGKDL
jgi:hypothetical protein